MKIAIAILVVFGVLAAVFCAYVRVLTLMDCTGGDISDDMEEQFLNEDRTNAIESGAAETDVAQPNEFSA